jgi:hypothetical protein
MEEEEFYKLVRDHTSPTNDGDSVINHASDPGIDAVRLPKASPCDFVLTASKKSTPDKDGYTLIGRGWIDTHA